MSISNSLSNALSGLTAAARAAEIVSSNVSNATTDGYGRRVLETSSATVGGRGAGVEIVGVRRDVDPQIVADRRLADSGVAAAQVTADFYNDLQAAMGLPDAGDSFVSRVSKLESSLIEATSRPDSDMRLAEVVTAAKDLVGKLASVTDAIQLSRSRADQRIAQNVETLNSNLANIADLNGQIRLLAASGRDASGLMDQRAVLIDKVAEIVPVRLVEQEFGQVAVFSTNGAGLVNGTAAEFGFTPVGQIVPEMTLTSGALSGLTLNGQPLSTSGEYAPLAGGGLAALFDLRDGLAVEAQRELDAVARDLIERFQDPAIDPTRIVGDAGLITDNGGVFDPVNEVGLAARLQVNALIDPDQGGALWRLRDGLGASAPGSVGDSTLLMTLSDALTDTRSTASGRFAGGTRSMSGLGAEVLSFAASELQSARSAESFANAKGATLRQAELEGGVDIDQEMQMLLQVERAYAANARVVQTMDELLDTLLRI
ncbi:flagellar hook protein FlgK [Actibacterium mucosum KCTC 23349]|uniref:Flagellar hook-associated protein 1 n=1 Tax=Actibacterium mucosum KCTC 23349 TaxID=1454373 RepID=A0A037ZMK4_9RHOB|nr:flagellar hook-associated protein FlgK [Actibacterium mucosum]KAJ57324.1 flagellar hook protein FlgK [Actibacterium mucosum KCTC 23349]